MSIRNYTNNALPVQTTAQVLVGDTTITVSSAASFPASFPYTIVIDPGLVTIEVCLVTAAASNVLTVTRGYDGTAAVAHSNAATVYPVAAAIDDREANAHVNATASAHGTSSALVGVTDTQTLSNKTLDNTTVLHATSANISGTTAPANNVYLTNSTWTKPAGLKAVRVRVVGGGAGGGGCTGGTGRTVAGGGGGGGYSEALIAAASLGATETVTVGGGGAGGANGTANGSNGTSSSFGSHCSATGGTGGAAGGTSTTVAVTNAGGAGGLGSGGDINAYGGAGGVGFQPDSSVAVSGAGGSSFLSGGPLGDIVAGTGNTAGGYGTGGSGGHSTSSNEAGGPGAGGVVIVENIYF